jgi:large repetitive protein
VQNGAGVQTLATIHFVAQPTIAIFTPDSGGANATVTLTGTNLTGTTHVWLNGTSAAFSVVSDTELTFTVPGGATSGTITVANPGAIATSAGTFTVDARPAITGFTPGSGPVGTPVTITGTHLAGTVGVMIGHTITVPTAVGPTSVTFTIPPGAVSGTITILSAAGSATSPTAFVVTS